MPFHHYPEYFKLLIISLQDCNSQQLVLGKLPSVHSKYKHQFHRTSDYVRTEFYPWVTGTDAEKPLRFHIVLYMFLGRYIKISLVAIYMSHKKITSLSFCCKCRIIFWAPSPNTFLHKEQSCLTVQMFFTTEFKKGC